MSGNKRLHHVISESRVFTTRNIEFIIRPAPKFPSRKGFESLHAQRVYNHGQEFAGKRNLFYIYVWNKRITLKILPCMAALNTFRTDGEDFGEQILSKVVKAGRRTYFLDVRATRANDYFLTITESRKKTAPDGTVSYDRHKIFLYKEDFSKFLGSRFS